MTACFGSLARAIDGAVTLLLGLAFAVVPFVLSQHSAATKLGVSMVVVIGIRYASNPFVRRGGAIAERVGPDKQDP